MKSKVPARLSYPPARIETVTDTLSGVSFADPYRWLEGETEEVRRWQSAQAELASSQVREWPAFEELRALVRVFNIQGLSSVPRFAGGRWFRVHFPEGASQAQVIVAEEVVGEGRVLSDAMTERPERPPFVSWIAPSPDGCTLALGICADGSESNTIRLIDVATGRTLPDPPPQTLMDNWGGGAHWLPDSSGFFFNAISGAATDIVMAVYLHRRAPVPMTEVVDVPWQAGKDYRIVVISPDGRYAVAIQRLMSAVPIATARVGGADLTWRPFLNTVPSTVAGYVLGDRYIAVTDAGAPRGRLVAIELDAPNPNDPATWQELLPESAATLRTVTPVGDLLYLTEFVDTYARIRIVDRDGRVRGEVPLPERGAIVEMPFPLMTLVPRGHPNIFVFGFSSLTASTGIYSHAPGEAGINTLKAPAVRLDNTVVEDRWAVSSDGARIPYHLVRRADVSADRPQPTLIYAYGGFNAALAPQFPGPMAAFVAAGGVFVHAHLRGGAEFGRDWWEGGRLRNKQNCYHDLYAVAEHLIADRRATPQTLAVTGGSNGGLMAGVAVTQRPDLWKAVVPRVPLLDLIGACRQAYGRMAVVMEFADVDDPAEVRRLAMFSPYQLVRDGVEYPAVFIDAGDTDPRCPPWHSRKFIARLQAASSSGAPILMHVWENVGHGWATDKEISTTENTEWLAFVLRQLCIDKLPGRSGS